MPGGWHHGDDIFSPLGQPVLAVATGRVYSVGWNRVGGWRLWLRDSQGNRFYYAHLSGYTKFGRNGTHVKAGQQLAFIGNTGDAFTTPHHLHFEIHPAGLLYLQYGGAVDPTTYLEKWHRVGHVTPLAPIPLPAGAATHGDGAVSDYRQLLAVRGIRRPPSTVPFPIPLEERPIPLAVAAAGVPSTATSSALVPDAHRRAARGVRPRRARGVGAPARVAVSRLTRSRVRPGAPLCAGCAARRRCARRDRTRTRSS